MRSVHSAASWDDVSILSHQDISGWQSLCLTQGRLMKPVSLLQAKNMNPILLAATWLTACEGSLQWLAQPSTELSRSCSKLQDTNPICCPTGTYVAVTQEMVSAFSPLLSLLLSQVSGGYDGSISDYNDRNCVTLNRNITDSLIVVIRHL